MQYSDLDDFLRRGRTYLARGPVAVILAEDAVALHETVAHHLRLGFRAIILLVPPGIPTDFAPDQPVAVVAHRTGRDDGWQPALNRIIAAAQGQWLYYCFNAEFLFFPFCETRRIGEMLTFHSEERRDAMLTYVIDLYAGDLTRAPNAVDLSDAWLDRSGYYASVRTGPDGSRLDRQYDFFGGLRWRYEEHVPANKRRIDRIALFRAAPDLELQADHRFNRQEYNTYACPWHHNLTAAVCSFRTAKALRANPGSRHDIPSFRWQNSTRFDWKSQQLLDMGLMEPGQWF